MKRRSLQELLRADELTFVMEAHNALSARIVEEAGFEAIWASGLAISASMGLCDRNEASWSQVLDVVELMTDHTTVPILVDGDTGFGNFNNVRRVVRKLCQYGAAGVCLEDKQFPKRNSFTTSTSGDLAEIPEFCGRIKAAKDGQTNGAFCVVARVESLIVGQGMSEAVNRAGYYHEAGADAILIHSKRTVADEVISFAGLWKRRCPLIVVPTTYYRTEAAMYRVAGISAVIWANHGLRASIAAIRNVAQTIRKEESVGNVESEIASISDVFALTNEYEVQAAETECRRYEQQVGREVEQDDRARQNSSITKIVTTP